jgi:hypothetical protein
MVSMRLATFASLIALGACTTPSPTTKAHVALEVQPGWTGTTELMVHTAAGALVSRAPITANQDVAIEDGDTVSVVLHDGGNVVAESDLDVSQGDTLLFVVGPLGAPGTNANITVNLPSVPNLHDWEVSGPDARSIDKTTAPVQITVPASATSVPVIAEAVTTIGTRAVYASASAPIASFAINLSTPADYQVSRIVPVHMQTGAVGPWAAVFVGVDWLDVAGTLDGYAVPTAIGDKVELAASESPDATHVAAGSFAPGSAPALFQPDLAFTDMPPVTPMAVSGTTITWGDDAGTGYDVIEGFAYDSATPAFTWEFDARPGSGKAAMPAFPADLGAPASFDSKSISAYDRSSIAGYDAALATDGASKPGETWREVFLQDLKQGPTGPLAPGQGHRLSRR